MIEQAKRFLEPEKTVFLVTTGEDGQPNLRAMTTVRSDHQSVWMLTDKSSDKHRELAKRPKCMLYATELEDMANYLELRLWGNMELLDDPASRALAWRDEHLEHFPGGKDDPNLCVLKFTAESGVLQTMAGKEKLTL